MIDEDVFKANVYEAVKEAMEAQNGETYQGFADVNKFIEISGISKWDIEHKFMPHPKFKEHVYQMEGRKRYVDVHPALETMRKIFKEAN